jgi:DNA-binding CsgD family transcriptional regulator
MTHAAENSPDLLSIVEAAYSIDAPDRAWAENMLKAVDRAVGAGVGAFACEFEEQAHGTIAINRPSVVSLGVNDDMLEGILSHHATAPAGLLSRHFARGRGAARCLLTSEILGAVSPDLGEELAERGVHDGINIAATDLDDRGYLLSLAVPRSYRLTPTARRALTRVATHVLAAIRLRRRLGLARCVDERPAPDAAVTPAAATPDAILSVEGKLLHAEGDAKVQAARQALAQAVRTIEHARSAMRDRQERAVASWKGLVGARWTLVDQFDGDGARYVVARENAPVARGPERLTATERAVVALAARGLTTKEIAYALGIADTTVRVLVMRAARRCGVGSRGELLAFWASSTEAPSTKH